MLNIVYDRINDFINSYMDKLKPYKDLLNSVKYYRGKKINRILNDPSEVISVTPKKKEKTKKEYK